MKKTEKKKQHKQQNTLDIAAPTLLSNEATQTKDDAGTLEDEGAFDDITSMISTAKDFIVEETEELINSPIVSSAIEIGEKVIEALGENINNIDIDL